MSNNRIGRINEEIGRELSAALRQMKDPRVNGVVSVTAVETSADLRYAKVFVSVLDRDQAETVLKGLKSASGWLRRELGNTLSLRYVPELIFSLDPSIGKGAHIFELLKRIEQQDQTEGKEDNA